METVRCNAMFYNANMLENARKNTVLPDEVADKVIRNYKRGLLDVCTATGVLLTGESNHGEKAIERFGKENLEKGNGGWTYMSWEELIARGKKREKEMRREAREEKKRRQGK